ncbi:transporter substrate-binding domain-containing protein [Legionella worsleiensis]|uniref:Arginine ABC transporter substrate-binding protein n=1 Tax=Legionella worsleiensis TaxID=45076 RepID=A0A0W1AHH2_9GAMM|nr:transporter substrate-binding domain-containing protein [Legionella worsleiensis]KTD80686.1 arginine ABC transporter substrate-binding protein [Legionella worsleiensis]STY32736.1 arginine ABC transporter substrate-binding protein [Legionella worsleiensis]
MNFFRHLTLIAFLLIMSPLHAEEEALNVGIDSFTPPFVMEGNKKEYYGFDIDLISSVCKIMNRTCTYVPMPFEDLLSAVENNKVDIAISSITITADRAKIVNFSTPYISSYSRFLTIHGDDAKEPFSLRLLKDKKIGVVVASVFKDQIKDMGIINPAVIEYPNTEVMLEDLRKGDIDFVLFDNPTALYWAANSSGAFHIVGKRYIYGYGLGLAVNKTNSDLLQAVNQALKQYEQSQEFKSSYSRYLTEF